MLSVTRAKDECVTVRGGTQCEREGRCLGYDSQEECPPLIVFAIQARELATAQVSALIGLPAGGR